MFSTCKKSALMTSIIFSPQLGHVEPIASNKMTTVISDNFRFPWDFGTSFWAIL